VQVLSKNAQMGSGKPGTVEMEMETEMHVETKLKPNFRDPQVFR
jgi:hypothetical protein